MATIQARQNRVSPWVELTEKQLAAFCLQKTGGGRTPVATMKAMRFKKRVLEQGYKSNTGFEIRVTGGES